jgi:hypothetical protein
MRNSDLVELFDLTPARALVEIVEGTDTGRVGEGPLV